MADVAEVIYMPALLLHLAKHAPQVSVTTQLPTTKALRDAMQSGKIDLVIGYFPDFRLQQFFKQRLYSHSYACLARKKHPLSSRLTVRACEQCGHAVALAQSASFFVSANPACLGGNSVCWN